jgi:hypothetical protein
MFRSSVIALMFALDLILPLKVLVTERYPELSDMAI